MATTTSPELVTGSAEETESAGERLGSRLRAGDLLVLVGQLGSGKTTFVRGLAKGLGVAGHVASPTFQLVRVYKGSPPLAHVDLYRVGSQREFDELGLEELLETSVMAVEWGERLPPVPALRTARLEFQALEGERRIIRFTSGPLSWSS